MLAVSSPYASHAANLREQGYHVIPISPQTKTPGQYSNGGWAPMPGWTKYCDQMPPEFIHDRWEQWPEAGIGLAHGAVIGLDMDTDRQDVHKAMHAAISPPTVRRKGRKGWMGYFRKGGGLEALTARVRWYDKDGNVTVELLLHGTQSVMPPSIHPDTGLPYQWITPDTLEDVAADDLPVFTGDDLAALDREFAQVGLTRQAPRRVNAKEYERPAATANDLEKPFGRSVNDRAMEAIDSWWPALEMPKSRMRGPGAWEAVPFWRVSNSGRSVSDRNPNLKAVPSGIVDFGADRSYTPIDLVMAARDCSMPSAVEWLEQFVQPEATQDFTAMTAPVAKEDPPEIQAEIDSVVRSAWAPIPVFTATRSYQRVKPVAVMMDAEYAAMMPTDPGPFPIQDPSVCGGLLGEMAAYLDAASTAATEAGGIALALPLLGAMMGKAFETPTGLRTNIYTVALSKSGSGKTSLVNPASELMILSKMDHLRGYDGFASGQALLAMLEDGNAKVCFLDEFGHTLKSLSSNKAGSHEKKIIEWFTKLYSSANTIVQGVSSLARPPAPLDCPHLCLFGMATPEQFWEAFGSGALEDGSVARYLVFPLGDSAQKDQDLSCQAELLENIAALATAIRSSVTGNMGKPQCVTVPFDDDAEAERKRLIETMAGCAEYAERNAIKGGGPIFRRVAENAAKIALISAVGRNPTRPRVTYHDFAIGHALARWSASVMVNNIGAYIADNQYEANLNKVLNFIKAGGPKGRAHREVQRALRGIAAREMTEILERLEEDGTLMVHREMPGGGGKARKTYRVRTQI